MMLFTSYISDPEVQYDIGFSMIAVVCIEIIFSMGIVCKIAGKSMVLLYIRYKKIAKKWMWKAWYKFAPMVDLEHVSMPFAKDEPHK